MARNRDFDVVRSLAIIGVVLYHFTIRYEKLYGYASVDWFSFGNLGVQLFFMLSGYFIYNSLLHSGNSLDFLQKRLTRLYPPYWICIIITFLIVSIFGLPGREVGISSLMVNFTMLQTPLGITSVDGSYWSLFYELSFYTLISLFCKLIKLGNWFIWVAWLLLYVFNQSFIESKVVATLFSLTYMPFFLSGIMFSKLNEKKSLFNSVLPVICLICYFFVYKYLTNPFVKFIKRRKLFEVNLVKE